MKQPKLVESIDVEKKVIYTLTADELNTIEAFNSEINRLTAERMGCIKMLIAQRGLKGNYNYENGSIVEYVPKGKENGQ